MTIGRQKGELAEDGDAPYTWSAMAVVISMLRGVNVGGRRIKMNALRELYESLKLEEPQTYVQSGNVIFRTRENDFAALASYIEKGIAREFGFRAGVVLRTPGEMREVIAKNPFAKRSGIEPSKLLVLFLAAELGAAARESLKKIRMVPEEMRVSERYLYIHFPDGMARPSFSWNAVDRALGMVNTGRNWNTVNKLLEMAEELEAS